MAASAARLQAQRADQAPWDVRVGAPSGVASPGTTDEHGRLRRLVDEGLLRSLEAVPLPLRALCGEALGITDLDGRPRRGGGKRLRPVLCLLACEACGSPAEEALPAALALECVHAFSLVHDDIVDGDRQRRGRPSLWAAVGLRLALNAGDALHALGSLLATQAGPWPGSLIECATMAMIEGQHLDLTSEHSDRPTVDAWREVARRKTGALFAAAIAAGAASAGATDAVAEGLWRVGELLGLHFQARDDILGVWGDPAVTGKPAAEDLARRTLGLPVACAAESESPAAAALRAAFADPATPVPRLLALLDACSARRRAEAVEDAIAAEVRDRVRSEAIPDRLAAVVDGLVESWRDRTA